MTNPNDLAYPELTTTESMTNEYIHKSKGGLSKREIFAAMAMQGIVVSSIRKHLITDIALWSVEISDALIKALNEKEGNQ